MVRFTKTTRAQREAIFKVFQRDFPGWLTPTTRLDGPRCPHCGKTASEQIVKVPSLQYRRFRRTVEPGPGCLMIPWKGMWLGVEPDGYTHS